MSLDYEESAWSEIERADRFLDGISSSHLDHTSNDVRIHQEQQLKDGLASSFYDLLNAATLETGHLVSCNFSEVHEGHFLGIGATMTVYQATWRNRAVAIKKVNIDSSPFSRSTADHILSARIAAATLEIRLMTNDYVRASPNLVDVLALAWEEVQVDNGMMPSFFRPVLVVEPSIDGNGLPFTLDRYLEISGSSLDHETKTHLLCGIANGLAVIHSLSVVHGDLKPANILIFHEKTKDRHVAKLSDFGFSSIEPEKGSIGRGTFLWTAPECLDESPDEVKEFRNTITRDLYGFGLIIWYLLFERIPFYDDGGRLQDRSIIDLKLEDKMADELDKIFSGTYKMDQPSSQPKAKIESTESSPFLAEKTELVAEPEKVLDSLEDTIPHTLRIYMASFLSLNPRRRFLLIPGGDLQEFATHIWDKNVLQENYDRYLQGTWQDYWSHRLNTAPLYTPPIDWLRRPAGGSSHPLRLPIHALSTQNSFSTIPRAMGNCPSDVKQMIFEDALKRAAGTTGEKHKNAVATVAACYLSGFGVEKNTRAFNKWCRLGADLGHVDCMYNLILSHHDGLGTGDFVKINRKQLMEYAVEILFHNAMTREGNYFDNRLQKSQFLRLKEVLCTRPTHEFHGVWPVMKNFVNYIVLGKEVNRDKVVKVVREFSENPELVRAAEAVIKDDPLALSDTILANPKIPHIANDRGQTILHLASMMDRGGLVVSLINRFGVDPFARDKEGNTPIELALHLGSIKAAQAIIHYVLRKEGYTLSSKKIDLLGILNKHITEGNGAMASILLSWTIFVKDEKVFSEQSIRQIMIDELLRLSVSEGNWLAFCAFLRWGANPNYCRPGGPSYDVLCQAIARNQPIMAATLLALGANADGFGRQGVISPLHFAAVGSGYDHDPLKIKEEALYRLGKQFENAMTFFNLYPCHSTDLQRFSIHVLLAYGADIELPDKSGRSPLSGSIEASKYNCHSKFLVERKSPADINSADFTGSTALHFAVKAKDLQRLDFCLQYGADCEIKDLKGRTALAVAAVLGQLRICQRLLGAGANIAARDANGNTCLELALHSEELTVYFLNILRKAPREKYEQIMNNRDHQGRSIVHVAVTSTANKRVPASVLKLLLDEGANPVARDHLGYTPLHWIISAGDTQDPDDVSRDCLEILLQHEVYGSVLFCIPDDVLGLTTAHFLGLFRRIDLVPTINKHAALTFAYFAGEIKGTYLHLTTMELLDKVKQIESRYSLKIIDVMMRMSLMRAPILNPNRVIAEYRGLERISNLRKQAFYGEAHPKQIEYDYFASGEMIEAFFSRPAWIVDAEGRPRGTKLLSTFTEDHLNPRVWILDIDGVCHGILGNLDGSLHEREKENEGWTQEQWKDLNDMMLQALNEVGSIANYEVHEGGPKTRMLDTEKFKKLPKQEPWLQLVKPPQQREDGEWIWPDNGCEMSGMEAAEAKVLGDMYNPTDLIEYIETPLYG